MPRPAISGLSFRADPAALAGLPAPLLRRAVEIKRLLECKAEITACEKSLATFLRLAWPTFDSSPFTTNWHIDAVCEHLVAVSNGQIKRLLINVPPRTGKTSVVAIAWPVWTWSLPPNPDFPLHGPGVRFLCGSYGATKAEIDGVTARRLIGSTWFQERWGDRVQIAPDRDNQGQYDNTAGGSRISTGIPESLGKGGAIRILDDPHKTAEVESEVTRQSVIRGYDEVWRTRSNDPTTGAEVIVMQRLAEGDISGHVLRERDVVHLMLPMEFDASRRCHTVLGFTDPRKRDGELLWPQRFTATWAKTNKETGIGPHAWAGQFQQSPSVRGGGIVPAAWWQVWPPEGQEDSWTQTVEVDGRSVERMLFPSLDYVLVSVDTAYTEKEENDYSACTVWGSFQLAGNPKIILLEAWRERLEMRALVMKILDTARRRKADGVLIEAKASGLSVIQEMRRLMRDGEFTLFGDVPKGDKVARLHAVSPAFSAGLVYAPQRKWSDMVIDEVASFPRSRYADLTDSVSAGVNKLRRLGVVQQVDEVEAERNEALAFRGNQPSVRQEYGV